MATPWTTERKIISGFALAMVVLGAVAIISVASTLKLLAALNAVSEQVITMQRISEASSILPQMASMARLFAASPSDAGFEDWQNQVAAFQKKLDEVEALTKDSQTQVDRLAEMRRRLEDKVKATRRDSTRAEIEDMWGIKGGVAQMRPISEMLSQMNNEEREVLAARNNSDARPKATAALWAIGLVSMFAVVLVGGAATVILRDLRQRQAASRELDRARQAAEAASVAKSAFLANMSHELRTPLTSIMGYADLLLEPQVAASRRPELLQTLRRSGEHLLILINDILDVSKIEAGRMSVERVETPLADILADLDSLMRSRALDKGLDFSVQFATPIPERAVTDPTRFRQILMNLVGNAIKFTDEGNVRVRVSYAAPRISVEVHDTGVGITPEQMDRLFQPFVQADLSTTRRFGGTGLGLSISRRLAHMMGGELVVKSTPDVGSTFTLALPMEPAAGAALVGPGLAHRAVAGVETLPPRRQLGIRILLAEDGPENRDVLMHHLRHAGCDVDVAQDGQQAYEMTLRARRLGAPYDVVLMDMQMPVMDGYTATGKLRAEGYTGAIIAITAHAMVEDRERCLRAGCDDYAAKPIDMPALLGMLARQAGTVPQAAARGVAGNEALVQLTRKFCDSMPEMMQRLRDACVQQDWNSAAAGAHRLAGAGGAYGFAAITQEAKRLERAVRAPEVAAHWQDALAALQQACDNARAASEPAATRHEARAV